MLIDTHTHLYLPDFDEDRTDIMDRCEKTGVKRVYLPAIDSRTHESMLKMELEFPEMVYSMMGLHPCSVKENFEEELAICEKYLGDRKFVAIGEIGIDLFWDKTFVEEQKIALIRQCNWARDLDIPVVIHSRESMDLIIQILKKERIQGLTGIFHCFTGSTEQAMEAIKLGFNLGIGGVLTYKNTKLGEHLIPVPMEHLVLETDSPYLTPVPFRGKRNESSYIRLVAEKLAQVKDIDIHDVERITTENALRIFKN
jgi:TatD DNase family protein